MLAVVPAAASAVFADFNLSRPIRRIAEGIEEGTKTMLQEMEKPDRERYFDRPLDKPKNQDIKNEDLAKIKEEREEMAKRVAKAKEHGFSKIV